MSGHGEIVSILHPLSFDGKDATNGTSPSVETLMAEGKTRLKEWEEKNKAKQLASSAGGSGGGANGSGTTSCADGSVLCFTADQLEPTTPAVSPEAEAESEKWKEQGNEAYKRKDYRAAIEAYTKAINLRGMMHFFMRLCPNVSISIRFITFLSSQSISSSHPFP